MLDFQFSLPFLYMISCKMKKKNKMISLFSSRGKQIGLPHLLVVSVMISLQVKKQNQHKLSTWLMSQLTSVTMVIFVVKCILYWYFTILLCIKLLWHVFWLPDSFKDLLIRTKTSKTISGGLKDDENYNIDMGCVSTSLLPLIFI